MAGRGKPSEAQFIESVNGQSDTRLFLIFGQDPSMILDIAEKIYSNMGSDAERIDIDSEQLRKDPALLADEAGSIGLFGDKRYIRLNIRREEGYAAIENLLEAEQAGNPVIAMAGDLKKTSKIRKLAEKHKFASSFICYAMDEGKMAALIVNMARDEGLSLDRQLATRIARATGCDRKLAAMEVQKLALYYDAQEGGRTNVEPDAFEALCAETDEENINALVNHILGGNIKKLGMELLSARQTGIESIRLIRSLQRRVALLISMRGQVDAGRSATQVADNPRIFWKDKPAVANQLGRWPSPRLAGLNGHLLNIEKKLMSVNAELGGVILEEELTKISRAAARA